MLRYWKTNRSSPRHAIRERAGGRSTAARSALATKKRIRAAATARAARGRNIRERADASRRRKTALAPARRAEVKRGAADNRPAARGPVQHPDARSEEHTSELQSHVNLVCRLLLEKKKKTNLNNVHRT